MAVLDDDVSALGWFLVAPVMLGCIIMLAVALLINNIQRRFPYYWWSPEETGRRWKKQHHQPHQQGKHVDGPSSESEKGLEKTNSETSGAASASGSGSGEDEDTDLERQATVTWVEGERLVVSKNHVTIPRSMYLTYEEKIVLETLSQRLS